MRLVSLLLALLLIAPIGCSKGSDEKKATPQQKQPLAPVTVAAEGTSFKPPVQPEQLPKGAWYCDMGTVEYARMTPGDGRCPLCKMRLKQKP